MIKTIQDNWLKKFRDNLSGTDVLKIISPFISENMINHLLGIFQGNKIQVITRFDLNDFRSGVSSLKALEKLLAKGVEIKGIKGLHSKMYLFDSNAVIITSANFTSGGFFNNKEFGVITDDHHIIKNAQQYFKELWKIEKNHLTRKTLEEWEKEIIESQGNSNQTSIPLPDHGASYSKKIIQNRRYFIKFFGVSNNRADMNTLVENSIRYGVAHYALSFSKTSNDRRPYRYRDGDIVFMAQLSRHTENDYSIFARGVTIKHNRNRDVAGIDDFNHLEWVKDWPVLVRVKEVQFINGTYGDCPRMNDLIKDLDYECFESTLKNYKQNSGNISPNYALMQKSDVRLSEAGALWMEDKFEKAISKKGQIPEGFINQFYRGIIV